MLKYRVKTAWDHDTDPATQINAIECKPEEKPTAHFGQLYTDGKPECYKSLVVAKARLIALQAAQKARAAQEEFLVLRNRMEPAPAPAPAPAEAV